jgi:DNA-binding MarR family transcriptional regulator
VNGLELFRLGRALMKIGEQAIATAGYQPLPTSVRLIVADVFEHPDSAVGEIAERTGFPQSHVSASVARLRDAGAFVTVADPADRRRTLVRTSANVRRRAAQAQRSPGPINGPLGAALGTPDARAVGKVIAMLEALARRLAVRRARGGLRRGPHVVGRSLRVRSR